MEFEEALQRTKNGCKMRRQKWTKGQYIQIQECVILQNGNIETTIPLLYNANQGDLTATDWIAMGSDE